MKKIQKTFEIDRQVNALKFRATQPYGGYTPTYKIGYLPPNLFLPGRLYPPAPAPVPSGTIVEFVGKQALNVIISPPSTNIELYFHNLSDGGSISSFSFTRDTIDFTGTTVSIAGFTPSDYTVNISLSGGSFSVEFNSPPQTITETTLITVSNLPEAISGFDEINTT
jgi:hypothetical protein